MFNRHTIRDTAGTVVITVCIEPSRERAETEQSVDETSRLAERSSQQRRLREKHRESPVFRPRRPLSTEGEVREDGRRKAVHCAREPGSKRGSSFEPRRWLAVQWRTPPATIGGLSRVRMRGVERRKADRASRTLADDRRLQSPLRSARCKPDPQKHVTPDRAVLETLSYLGTLVRPPLHWRRPTACMLRCDE